MTVPIDKLQSAGPFLMMGDLISVDGDECVVLWSSANQVMYTPLRGFRAGIETNIHTSCLFNERTGVHPDLHPAIDQNDRVQVKDSEGNLARGTCFGLVVKLNGELTYKVGLEDGKVVVAPLHSVQPFSRNGWVEPEEKKKPSKNKKPTKDKMVTAVAKPGDNIKFKATGTLGRIEEWLGENRYRVLLDGAEPRMPRVLTREEFEVVEAPSQDSAREIDIGDGFTALAVKPNEDGMRALARRMATMGLQKDELRKQLIPMVVSGTIDVGLFRTANEEWDKVQSEIRDLAMECTATDIADQPGKLGKNLSEWEKRNGFQLPEQDKKIILTRAESRRQGMGGSQKESTMTMFDMIQDDAKEITLRLSVKEARKLLSSLMTEYLFATVQREHGESDEEFATRSKTFKNSVSTFMASDAGFGILSYVVGAFWPMVEEMVPEGEARELGRKIAREIRVSGGMDAAGDFMAKVVKPMIGFVVSSASHAGTSLLDKVTADQKKVTESFSGVRANPEAVDHRDEEIAALKAKLLESEAQRGNSTEKRANG
jgi:translation initiation factor IF-1